MIYLVILAVRVLEVELLQDNVHFTTFICHSLLIFSVWIKTSHNSNHTLETATLLPLNVS